MTAPIFNQLKNLANGLPQTAPQGVHKKSVENWDKRRLVAKNFFTNYEALKADIKVTNHSYNKPDLTNGWIYEVTEKPKSVINRLGKVDGAEEASRLGTVAKKKPLMLIAANREHIGGSLYRIGGRGTGDAQEEQAGNTYAGALALASCPGVSEGVEEGNICYTTEYRRLLSNRGAIEVTNVPGVQQGQVCDQLLVAAPDLENKKECFKKTGEFDYQLYQDQIYTMYNNVFSAIETKDPEQPIILTLPGAGVFLGEDENVRKQAIIIQGLCLRKVLQEKSDVLKDRQFSLPHAYGKESAQILDIVAAEPSDLIDKIDELKRLQMAQKNKMFATILDSLDDSEAKAEEITKKGAVKDGEKIKENIKLIREELLFAYPALNGESEKIDLDFHSKRIVQLNNEILPIAAKHGGLKQDLLYLVAAILDVFSLLLTTLLPDSVFKVGVEKDLLNFRDKFGLFKEQLQQVNGQEEISKNDKTPTKGLGS